MATACAVTTPIDQCPRLRLHIQNICNLRMKKLISSAPTATVAWDPFSVAMLQIARYTSTESLIPPQIGRTTNLRSSQIWMLNARETWSLVAMLPAISAGSFKLPPRLPRSSSMRLGRPTPYFSSVVLATITFGLSIFLLPSSSSLDLTVTRILGPISLPEQIAVEPWPPPKNPWTSFSSY